MHSRLYTTLVGPEYSQVEIVINTSRAARGGAGSFKNLSIYINQKKKVPIEIVFDMLGFNPVDWKTGLKIQHVEPQNEKPPSFCFDTTVQHAEITTHQVVETADVAHNCIACLSLS